MNYISQRYYKANRIALEMMGLWPYSNSILTQIYRAMMLTMFVSSSITQFAKLHSTIRDFDRLLYNLTYAVPSLIYILKFLTYIVYDDQLRQLLDRIQHDWNMFKDGKEREIIRYNAIIGMRYTITFYALVYLPLFGYIASLYIPTFLDIARPLNESRPRKLPILSEYFFLDEQEYYYPILVHQSMVILLGIVIVIATETLMMVCVQHGCGLFEVTSYRFKHVFDNNKTPFVSDRERYNVIHAKIAEAIMIHKRTVEFLDSLNLTFNLSYLVLLMLGIITITVNMFRAVTVLNDWEELLAALAFIIGQYFYMLFVNYFGQKVTDRSIRVFDMIYEAMWYTAPVQAQKLLIFMLQKTVKGYVMNISHLIVASLETFASLTSMTVSYLTLIYSVR